MKRTTGFAWLLALMLAACGSSNVGNGNIRVELTDAPAPYDAVNVTLGAVEAHLSSADSEDQAKGWITLVEDAGTHDLLKLQNDVTAVLGDKSLPAGDYTQLRLIVKSAEVVTGSTAHPLTIPSGSETGIKIPFNFSVTEGQSYVLVLDFDAAESVKVKGKGDYSMSPVVKVKKFAAE